MNKKRKKEKPRLYEKFKREKYPELYRKKEERERKCHFVKTGKILYSLILTIIMTVLIGLAAIGTIALCDEQTRQLLMTLL